MAKLDTKNVNDIKKCRFPRKSPICVAGYFGKMMDDKHHSYKLVDDNYGEMIPLELRGLEKGGTVSVKGETVRESELRNIKRDIKEEELGKD